MSTSKHPLHKASAVVLASSLTLANESEGATQLGKIQLFPLGFFAAGDGRPATRTEGRLKAWHLDMQGAMTLIAKWQAKATQTVVDYEHQSQLAESNGMPAPAAGWIENLYVQEDGLYADVAWTEKAKEHIRNGEYKYISPTFFYNPQTGTVQDLVCAALTNIPALDGMAPAKAKNAGLTGESTMEELLKAVRKALGLKDDAEVAACTAALNDLTKDKPLTVAMAELKSTIGKQESELALAKSATPDMSKFVPMESFVLISAEATRLSKQVEELQSGQNAASLSAEIEEAVKDGRLNAVSKPWALTLAKSDPKALKAFLDTAPKLDALKGLQSGGTAPDGDAQKANLSSEDKYAMEQLGLSEEAFLKEKK